MGSAALLRKAEMRMARIAARATRPQRLSHVVSMGKVSAICKRFAISEARAEISDVETLKWRGFLGFAVEKIEMAEGMD